MMAFWRANRCCPAESHHANLLPFRYHSLWAAALIDPAAGGNRDSLDRAVGMHQVHIVEQITDHAAMVGNDADPVADARPVRGRGKRDDAVLFRECGEG